MRVRVRWGAGIVALFALWATVTFAQSGRGPDFATSAELRKFLVAKAEQTVFPERCAECHKSEFAVWEDTLHATQFTTLHTKENAKEIYQALGLSLIRRATDEQTPACLQCHYTPRVDGTSIRASIGVSCESCHGPARDWIGVHNNYGVRSSDFQQNAKAETPEHRQQRIAESRAKGQLRSSDIYGVAANCFGCHTVPHETLVNVGGHSAGKQFELVGQLDKIRHNFLQSFLTGDGKTNAERPAAHKRRLYVVGRALEVEYSVRGVAVATKDDSYLQAMVSRHDAAVEALLEIRDAVAIPEIAQIVKIIEPAALKAGNRASLLAIADAVGAATRAFIARSNGSELGTLDPLWDSAQARPETPAAQPARTPQPTDPAVPPPVATPPVGTTPTEPAAPPTGGTTTPPPTGTTTPPPTGTTTPPPTGGTTAPPPAGERPGAAASGRSTVTQPPPPRPAAGPLARRPAWLQAPTHKVVACTGCHREERKWQRGDSHAQSLASFTTEGPGRTKRIEIASAYGLSPADMVGANQICMSCHGALTTGATVRVRNGVDCQQCHGAAEKYLDSHDEEETYAESIAPARGMVNLKDPGTRARTCMGCHYMTDARLLAAGHPSGSNFRLSERVPKIKHWRASGDMAPDRLQSAQDAVLAERGAVPAVTASPVAAPPVAAPPTPTPATPAGSPPAAGTAPPPVTSAAPATPSPPPASGGAGATKSGAESPRPTVAAPGMPAATPPPPPTAGGAETPVPSPASGTASVDPIGTSPVVNPEASVDERLLQIKRRLEQLYARLRGSGGG